VAQGKRFDGFLKERLNCKNVSQKTLVYYRRALKMVLTMGSTFDIDET